MFTFAALTMHCMKIAIDFDGTIVEHAYPAIGKEIPFAFSTLKMLQQQGHLLVLWTFRSGDLLQEAIDFCQKNGVMFYAVNASYPEEVYDPATSRKIDADIFIDDRNLGGFPGWGEVFQMLHPDEKSGIKIKKKKSFFSFIK